MMGDTFELDNIKNLINSNYLWDDITSYINSKFEEHEAVLLDKICGVGEVLMTTREGNPSTWLGRGTWEQLPEGLVPISAGSTYLVNQQYGQSTITLTTDQMPSHTHTGSTDTTGAHDHEVEYYQPPSDWTGNTCSMTNTSGNNGFISCLDRPQWERPTGTSWVSKSVHENNTVKYSRLTEEGEHSHSFTTDSSGLGDPIDIHQPSIAYYFWRRIS